MHHQVHVRGRGYSLLLIPRGQNTCKCFAVSLHLLSRYITVLMNKKTACKRWYHIQVRSTDNLSSPPKTDFFGVQSWFREERKQALTLSTKVTRRLSCKQDFVDCSCSDFVVVFVLSRLTKLILLKPHLKAQMASVLTTVSSEDLCCGPWPNWALSHRPICCLGICNLVRGKRSCVTGSGCC